MTNLPTTEDKRQFPRVQFGGRALIRTERHTTFIPCEPRNVSLGGMCLRLHEDIELRSEVDVQLMTDDLPQPLQYHGRVNWTTARLDVRTQPPLPYDVGIEFEGLSPPLLAALQRIIEAWRRPPSAIPS